MVVDLPALYGGRCDCQGVATHPGIPDSGGILSNIAA